MAIQQVQRVKTSRVDCYSWWMSGWTRPRVTRALLKCNNPTDGSPGAQFLIFIRPSRADKLISHEPDMHPEKPDEKRCRKLSRI